MFANTTREHITMLRNTPRFAHLHAKAINSKAAEPYEELTGANTHRGFYFNKDDSSGVFTSPAEIDDYFDLLASNTTNAV